MQNKELHNFLNSQRLLVIASADGVEPWVANVFYGIGEDNKLYFVSSEETIHSQHILKNKAVAFSIARYDKNNHKDRKAIQGKGTCRLAESEKEIVEGVRLHNLHFPEFSSKIDVERIKSEENKSRIWVIDPSYIKFWNDELYGENGTEEFMFND